MSIEKPLISLVLLSYNQTAYIEDALKGVLSQTYPNLEIILSDDCSPDDTFALIKKLVSDYRGPHTIVLNKNDVNLGLISHVNKAFEMASGEIVVLAAGDDISLPTRVSDIVEQFDKDDSIYSVSTSFIRIDEHNNPISKMNIFDKDYYTYDDYCTVGVIPIFGCSRAYRREVFSFFGPLKSYASVEDATLVFRSILLGKSYHINKVGLHYRVLSGSLSSGINLNTHIGKNRQRTDDTKLAIKKGLRVEKALIKLQKHKLELISMESILDRFESEDFSMLYFIKNILLSEKFDKNYKYYLLKQVFSKRK